MTTKIRSWAERIAPMLFGASLAAWHYHHVRPLDWPMLDDTAIILKYLDNFARGCFYCYNRVDGPVFGISCFTHGILAGALAFLGVQPEHAVIVSNLVGAAAFYTVCVLIFRRTYASTLLGIAATLLLFAASVYGRETFMTGMETPLHVAIVFAAILAFLARSPLLGFLCAAAIISKLDAAAPMVVLLGLDLARSRTEFIQWLRGMVLRFALPLATWGAFAFLVFGSPVPQTLVAKQFFHPKATGGWFPFLQGMVGVNDISAHIIAACCLSGIAIAAVWRKSSACCVFALCGIATLVPYYFYNPGERMHWYYALPEVCFLGSTLAFPAALREIVPAGRALRIVSIGCAACLAIGALCARSSDSETLLDWSRMYARLVETDRIAAGRALRNATAPDSTVYAGHGHIARESHRRVIDFSGLNSRFATGHSLSLASMFEAAPPAGIATHGLIPEVLQRKYRLELRESFYNVTALGYEPFRVFAAVLAPSPAMIASPIPHDAVVGGVWHGPVLMAGQETAFQLRGLSARRLTFGLREAANTRTVLLIANTVEATRRCEIPAAPNDCAACTIECSVEAGNRNFLFELTLAAIDGSPIEIINPVIVRDASNFFAIHPALDSGEWSGAGR